MKLSIIIPVYNVKEYLCKCIESILKISEINKEIILVNDGSTDGSDKICEKYFNKNKNIIKYITQKNAGLSEARNTGIKAAEGDYIQFVDSDDYIDGDKLVNLWDKIKKIRPDIAYFGLYYEGEKYKIIKYQYKAEKDRLYNTKDFLRVELENRNLPVAACFGLFKTALIKDNNLYFKTGILHEDERWSPELLSKSKIIYTSSEIIYHYVQRDNSIMHKKDKTKNGIDMIETCKYLDTLNFGDRRLNKLFKNRQAMVYMRASVIGKLYKRKDIINRVYPITHVCKIIDILKSILYLISPKIYYCVAKRKDD